jgi:hypothetical protein
MLKSAREKLMKSGGAVRRRELLPALRFFVRKWE